MSEIKPKDEVASKGSRLLSKIYEPGHFITKER